jgi:hypothetical protein
MKSKLRIGLAALCALALVAAGCGSDGNGGNGSASPTATHPGHETAASVDGGAASLRASLTAMLEDHVYLAGLAVNAGVGSGLDSAAFKAAAGALDKNSVELANAIGSVYGEAAGKQFLSLWRRHIGFFVDYTKAKATKDAAGVRKAKADLDGYRAQFGAFLASANPNLTKKAVADDLKPHVQTLFGAIDAVIAKSPTVFDKLKIAASHMPMTADILAGAIVKQFPDKFGA